ncbi:MAG: hypothetical protein AB8F74_17010 [Saprospiraceae bacterium]
MNKLFLFLMLFIAFNIQKGHSCSCAIPNDLSTELNLYNQIFLGKVLRIDTLNDKKFPSVEYHFEVRKRWKGILKEQVNIYSGFGDGGDCGFVFTKGKTYIVYATENETNQCTRNSLIEESFDERLLNNIFRGHIIDVEYDLYDKTKIYNRLRLVQTSSTKQRLVVMKDYKYISKPEFYKLHPVYSTYNSALIELTPKEKSKLGDCIDLIYATGYQSKKWKRRKTIRRLKRCKVCAKEN